MTKDQEAIVALTRRVAELEAERDNFRADYIRVVDRLEVVQGERDDAIAGVKLWTQRATVLTDHLDKGATLVAIMARDAVPLVGPTMSVASADVAALEEWGREISALPSSTALASAQPAVISCGACLGNGKSSDGDSYCGVCLGNGVVPSPPEERVEATREARASVALDTETHCVEEAEQWDVSDDEHMMLGRHGYPEGPAVFDESQLPEDLRNLPTYPGDDVETAAEQAARAASKERP